MRAVCRGRRAGIGLALIALAAACGSPPAPGPAQSVTELKYVLFTTVGPIWFCDPDFYPVGRLITPETLDARVKEIQNDTDVYAAILAHNHFDGTLTPSQKQVVYDDFKRLRALSLEPDGQRYRFSYLVAPADGKLGTSVDGTIERTGAVHVSGRKSGAYLNCPICLAEGTRIDTPHGELPVTQLRLGMAVWTLDAAGQRVAATIIRTASARTPAWHEVVHLALEDGRQVWVSPGHPTAEGGAAGDLSLGDQFDGSVVVLADRVRYAGTATYDLLPAGASGAYWANGILLRSTLVEVSLELRQ